MKVLLDTATVIAAIKGRLPVVLRLAKLQPADVAVSVVSRMEAEMALRAAPKTNARFARLLKEFFASVKVLDFTEAEAAQAVNLVPYLPQGAEALKSFELQLAAMALRHQLTLITESPQRFAFIPGLDAESWVSRKEWSTAPPGERGTPRNQEFRGDPERPHTDVRAGAN